MTFFSGDLFFGHASRQGSIWLIPPLVMHSRFAVQAASHRMPFHSTASETDTVEQGPSSTHPELPLPSRESLPNLPRPRQGVTGCCFCVGTVVLPHILTHVLDTVCCSFMCAWSLGATNISPLCTLPRSVERSVCLWVAFGLWLGFTLMTGCTLSQASEGPSDRSDRSCQVFWNPCLESDGSIMMNLL